MRQLAAILHHRPDPGAGPHHFDLLVGVPADGRQTRDLRDVRTWRSDRRPDELALGDAARVDPIDPHRRWWLTRTVGEHVVLREPLGEASVLESGRVRSIQETPAGLKLEVQWSQQDDSVVYLVEDESIRRIPQSPDRPASVSP